MCVCSGVDSGHVAMAANYSCTKTVIDSLCQNICKLRRENVRKQKSWWIWVLFNVLLWKTYEGERITRGWGGGGALKWKGEPPLSCAVWCGIDRLHAKLTWASDLPFYISLSLFSLLLFFSLFFWEGNLRRAMSRVKWPQAATCSKGGHWETKAIQVNLSELAWDRQTPRADNTEANALTFAQPMALDSAAESAQGGWGVCMFQSVKEKGKQADRWVNTMLWKPH